MSYVVYARHLPVGVGPDLHAVAAAIEIFGRTRATIGWDPADGGNYLRVEHVANKTMSREISVALRLFFRAHVERYRRAGAPWRWEEIEIDVCASGERPAWLSTISEAHPQHEPAQ